ncbi:MAG: molybdopterin cofactor-binding domain-containing protein [Hyphomicrobium sp.]
MIKQNGIFHPNSPDVSNEPSKISRRTLFKLASGAGVGLVIGAYLPVRAADGRVTFAPNPFVIVSPENTVTVIIKHLDKGQGAATGLSSLVAEEMDAAWSQIKTEFAPANADKYKNLAFGVQGVGGSTGLSNSYMQYREAGAVARQMLVAAAARMWAVTPDELKVSDGIITHGSDKTTFGAMADRAGQEEMPKKPTLKTRDKFVYIGKSFPRVDSRAKCTGEAKFTLDLTFPDMLIATMLRPPRFGATLTSFDASDAKKMTGVKDVIAVDRGIAIVADSTWSALKARDAVKAEWNFDAAETRSTSAFRNDYSLLLEKPGTQVRVEGDVSKAFDAGAKTVEAIFEFPYLAHAPMEPMDAVVQFDGKKVDVWTGSQMQTIDQGVAAGIFGVKPENVAIHTVWAGGSFGRRAVGDSHYVAETCQIVKALKTPLPVKLVWTREDDVKGGYYRPYYMHRIKAALDADGNISAWDHRIVGQSILAGTLFAASMIKDGIDATSVEGASNLPYAIPNFSLDLHSPKSKVPVLWWRSVGSTHTAHATEHMIDILAREAGKDPVAFRLAMLKDKPRHAGALKLAAEKAGWGSPTPAGVHRGVAVHESFHSYVAQIADVAVKEDGTFQVERVVCAVDCGIAVNPDVVKAQMEGGIGYGLGAALYSAITLTNGEVDQSNFHDYQVMRIAQMPKIDVHIVDSSEMPTGVGEPGTPVILPAVANALLAGTGVRTVELPMSKQSYKQQT